MTRGYELCRELLDEKTTFSALFSCNDDMALRAPQKRCIRQGCGSCGTFLLFGFDDAPSAKWLETCLSTAHLPIDIGDHHRDRSGDKSLPTTSRSKRSFRRSPVRWYCVSR